MISGRPAGRQIGWFTIYALAVLAMALLRLVWFPTVVVPLTYGLPLLLCLISGSIRANYIMASIFTVMTAFKALFLLDHGAVGPWYDWLVLGMQWANIWTLALVVHLVLKSRETIQKRNADLHTVNQELEASNEELAAREEEITRQNEELQSQTEELEQQTEELRQQAQEMEHQSSELQAINHELAVRESGLQALLSSARWIRAGVKEEEVLSAICNVACQIMPHTVVAAVIVDELNGVVRRRGFHHIADPLSEDRYVDSFASIVSETRQTAYIRDITSRPDLVFPTAPPETVFRSVLASPVMLGDKVVAVVKLFAGEPREWTVEEFRVCEWLATQTALAMQSVSYQHHLENEKRMAQEATIQKSQFLAAVSHDVRTPVNAISLLADMIEQQALELGQQTDLPATARDLKTSARALVELVSDVLDLARIGAGKQELEYTTFTLCEVLRNEVRQQAPQARTKNLRMSVECSPQDIWIHADKMKLARVVSNLIGNAIKFTDSGEVVVCCELGPDGSAAIHVRDTGVGIAPEQCALIFDEFYQIRNPERDRNKGTGLGLAICRRLVDSLGCRISVDSVMGKGSTFTVAIPQSMIVSRPPEQIDGVPNGSKASQLADIRILLVEDHDQTRRAATHLLVARGARVFQASSGRSALQMLTHEQPDVLLLDLMLPDMDGSDILRHLHSRPNSLRCVLAVSGDVREERRQEVCRLGAHDLVGKPLNIDVLTLAIQTHLRRAQVAH